MPAKAPIDENVKFLFACLIRSDYKTIDFTRVAADFSINPAAARMRWSRLKKTINVDDIASSILDGKKRRTTAAVTKARPSPPSSLSSVKVERAGDGALQLPLSSTLAVGITLKEEEQGGGKELAEQEGLAPVLFAGLPEPPKCRAAGAEEQVSVPVVDEAVGAVGGFAATQVPHLPRVAEAAAVEDPETGSRPPAPQTLPPVPVVRDPPTLKSEPKPQLGEGEEEGKEGGKTMKSEPPPTDAICESAGSTVAVAITTANGSKKRKVERT